MVKMPDCEVLQTSGELSKNHTFWRIVPQNDPKASIDKNVIVNGIVRIGAIYILIWFNPFATSKVNDIVN